ncbi:MAG TPA: nucleotidyl transferase AbiEii/AbiGii toxin family protein [Saprospiraceae bacterium]|nr:nucleotidyl transferase AbiEii/AbiGii toxin family protein [Lewinellaceae bacterium]HPQ99244.1 nucleotidyl transferase AbiEii/AbiGii toxin family protein [Saprospiraceae bacterium]
MLHKEAVQDSLLDLLIKLQGLPAFQFLRLVGGTSLALQIGHRQSIDIDLFGNLPIDSIELMALLKPIGRIELVGGSKSIHVFFINNIKTDIVNYPYNWLEDPIHQDGIRLAGLRDISAMKIEAITQRGSKKDFIDLFFLLEQYTLKEILNFYEQKYTSGNTWLALRSLTYFDDAENQPMPKMLKDVNWLKIKSRIEMEVINLIG